jgi:hypothetical protein
MTFTELEQVALEEITSQPVSGMELVREQLRLATVISREFTGKGFYTTLAIAANAPRLLNTLPLRQAFFRGADARVRGDAHELILFKLWEDQRRPDNTSLVLAALEGYCTHGTWPADESLIEVIRAPAA